MEILTFKNSKKNRNKIIISTIVLYIASVFYITSGIDSSNKFNLFLGFTALILSVYLTFKTFVNTVSVEVSTLGIKGKTNGMRVIEWKYIEGFEVQKIRKNKVLVILVNNHTEVLSHQNRIVASLMKTNTKVFGSPAVIVESEFNEPIEEAKSKIELFREQHLL